MKFDFDNNVMAAINSKYFDIKLQSSTSWGIPCIKYFLIQFALDKMPVKVKNRKKLNPRAA
jgi:hypothetical protein